MNNDIIEKVFSVYGNDLPKDRDLYQAKTISPVTMLEIRKAFGSYNKFRQAYLAKAMEEKKPEVAEKTKVVKDVKKSKK